MTHSPDALLQDRDFPRLKAYVIEATGLAYYHDKDRDLAARVVERLTATRDGDCDAYLRRLTGDDGEEQDALVALLTIGETFFFRHRELFDALRDVVLPSLLERNAVRRRLRIWSAGCSTGAEAYSLSILLRRELRHRTAGWDVSVLGTDVNRQFLAQAREGCFPEWAFRSVPAELRTECFQATGSAWSVLPAYRQGVSFQYHNMVTQRFPSLLHDLSAFDLVLCRNVMIYFDPPTVERLVAQFHETLADGGWLLVGHSEPNVVTFRRFRTVNAPRAVLYRKDAASVPAPDVGRLSKPSVPDRVPAPPRKRTPPERATEPLPQPEADVRTIRELADRGDLDAALAQCETLLRTHRLQPAVYFYQALVLEQSGQYAAAEKALRQAVYLDRKYVPAHYCLGLLLQRTGDLKGAARSLRNAAALVEPLPCDQLVPDTDDLTAGRLLALTRRQLGTIET